MILELLKKSMTIAHFNSIFVNYCPKSIHDMNGRQLQRVDFKFSIVDSRTFLFCRQGLSSHFRVSFALP